MINLFRSLALLLAFTTGAFAYPVGGGRALLSGGCPTAVQVGGACPTGPSLNFVLGAAWSPQGVPWLTVVRATPPFAYSRRLNGSWPVFAPNVARITDQGLLIEEARTNSLIWSQDFSNAAWTKTDTTPTANSTTAPDGTVTATLLTEGVAGTAQTAQSNAATTASVACSGDIFLKASANVTWVEVILTDSTAATGVNAWLNLSTGAVGTVSARGTATSVSATSEAAANGFWRLKLAATFQAGVSNGQILFRSASADNSSTRVNNAAYYAWQADFQVGAGVTSPILTTSVAVLRAADFATVSPFPNFGTAQTLYAQGVPTVPVGIGANQSIFSISDGSATNRTVLFRVPSAGQVNALINSAGNTVQPGLAGPAPANARAKMAVAAAIGASQGILAWNGTLSIATSPVAVISSPTVTLMNIGNNGTSLVGQWNGYVEAVAAWPNTRLSNATLQNNTSP